MFGSDWGCRRRAGSVDDGDCVGDDAIDDGEGDDDDGVDDVAGDEVANGDDYGDGGVDSANLRNV